MNELDFYPGDGFLASASPNDKFAAFFEDEGEAGYFYAVDFVKYRSREEDAILDALHIYNVRDVLDRNKPSRVIILWDREGVKCALLINGHPHAAFDFVARRGYCRTGFPNFADNHGEGCITRDHAWSDDAVAWLSEVGSERA